MIPHAYGLLLVAIFIGVIGQLLLKHGMRGRPRFHPAETLALVRNWPVVIGFGFYSISTLLYLKVLGSLDLSVAYPTVSLGYVLIIIMSRVFFKESISRSRWTAVGIICVGVVMVGFGAK